MKWHTEKEYMNSGNFFAFKLRNLHVSNSDLFYQVTDYIPNLSYINSGIRNDLTYSYSNNAEMLKSPEMDLLMELGGSHLPKISCPVLYQRASQKADEFQKEHNFDALCNTLQGIKTYGEITHVITQKLVLNKESYLNVCSLISELSGINKVFTSVFNFALKDQHTWQRFMSLTKQEKLIIRLLADGSTNKKVGEQLFISADTVKTHRRNIYKKMNINGISDLVRVSLALDLIKDL